MRGADGAVFVSNQAHFAARNAGPVTAHKWAVQVLEVTSYPPDRGGDYRFQRVDFPPPLDRWHGDEDNRPDDTLLPGAALKTVPHWGVFLRPANHRARAIRAEVERMMLSVALGCRVATETSFGDPRHAAVRPVVDQTTVEHYVNSVLQWLRP